MTRYEMALLVLVILLCMGCGGVLQVRDSVVVRQPTFLFMDEGDTLVTLNEKTTILRAKHMVIENEHWRITCERKDNEIPDKR